MRAAAAAVASSGAEDVAMFSNDSFRAKVSLTSASFTSSWPSGFVVKIGSFVASSVKCF